MSPPAIQPVLDCRDLEVAEAADDAAAEADRVQALGATRDARVEEHGMIRVRMRDPEGTEFCIEQA